MDEKKLLKDLGLSNYEIAVYLRLVDLGIAEASTLYKESGVPFGRIYEELNSLVSKGLVEIQDSRPKRYMARKPRLAFSALLKKRKEDLDNRFHETVEIISQIEETISKRMPQKPNEKAFFTVAVGPREIADMMRYNFDDAEKELCIIARNLVEERKKEMPLAQEIAASLSDALKRGVRLRLLVGDGFSIPDDIIEKEKLKLMLTRIEIRTREGMNSFFEICDETSVMIKIDNPAKPKELLAAIRIYDIKLTKELKKKFEELWQKAMPLDSSAMQ